MPEPSRTSYPILTIPGLGNSGPGHWQSAWECSCGHCHRVDLGSWDAPNRVMWVERLDRAIREAGQPAVLVAHSLGCLAVAWWASALPPGSSPVAGALLVAPPDIERFATDPLFAGFAPAPRSRLPFPSILVASRNDPYIEQDRSRALARHWGSRFVDAGATGHINADSGLGEWRFGQRLLERLIADIPAR